MSNSKSRAKQSFLHGFLNKVFKKSPAPPCTNFPEGLNIISLDRCDSTNNYLKSHYNDLKTSLPVLVTSACQSGGRGRDDRTWLSTEGKGLYSSFGFSMETGTTLHLLPLAAGISVIDTLKRICPMNFGLKWPNDILVDNKKIAGILIENTIFENQMFCVAGMGINLNHDKSDFPPDLQHKATSLKILTGQPHNAADINPLLANTFFHWLEKIKEGRREEIIGTAGKYAQFLEGREIRFHHNKKITKGIFKGINNDGGLILDCGNNTDNIYYAGEIT